MKNRLSLFAIILIVITLFAHRAIYPINSEEPLKVTDWDALGYYMYLPGIIVYDDITKLSWFDSTDRKYAISGGNLYQANKTDNGNYVCKYLGGVGIVQLPPFLIAHVFADPMGYPADGFSPPYQYAIAYGVIIYCLLALLLLRRILLRYFTDVTVALSLLLGCLATNFVQYAAIHNGMSHAFIFPLYVLVLYATIKWHERPSVLRAAAIGYIIGLATICRPTEAVMLFIPLFWDTQDKQAAAGKWGKVQKNKPHIAIAILFGLLGILPQLIYWKIASGHLIYDVGSSWRFLTPFFRVLFGWEKGWFIYTPVTIFFVLGMFFIKRYPFKNAVIWFCLLNIYIIISWADWRYGGSYSTRALVQSYPVFALPLAAFVQRALQSKWRFAFYGLSLYLVVLNLFQVWQYNQTILEGDMTRKYYSHVYFDAHPTPLDMSLMDNDEILNSEAGFKKQDLYRTSVIKTFRAVKEQPAVILEIPLQKMGQEQWLKIECSLKASAATDGAFLHAELKFSQGSKHSRVRLKNAISQPGEQNDYAFYIKVPANMGRGVLKVYLSSEQNWQATCIISTLQVLSSNFAPCFQKTRFCNRPWIR